MSLKNFSDKRKSVFCSKDKNNIGKTIGELPFVLSLFLNFGKIWGSGYYKIILDKKAQLLKHETSRNEWKRLDNK